MFFIDLLIYGLFFFLLFWKGKFDKCIDNQKQVLQNLNALRGIFAIEIVIGHVIRYDGGILYPLGKFMICGVAFFFFVSAMGLSISFKEKGENYLTYKFLLTKPLYLLALALLIYFINFFVDYIFGRGLGYYCKPIFANFFVATNWYIWMQIIFYVVFYIVYKYVKKYRLAILFLYTIIFCIVSYYLGFIEGWWASGLAFPMGLLFGEYYEKVKQLLCSVKGMAGIGLLILFGGLCLIISHENVITMVFMRNAMCIAAIIIFWYLCGHYRFGNNWISRKLCILSAELYVAQFIWLRLSEMFAWGYRFRLLFVCMATLLTAILIHPVVRLLKKARQKVSFTEKS